eukprot:TRINITY_DN23176_c0_g1_i1.p1 TRINITY_DN23176_c0_g1~~TRINITY_DN23176_c0_g1_i1.p1  ORF type:complete len:416 (+),score=124.54 TRINITY_DN23176_c0_g1_i1:77-1324(+)
MADKSLTWAELEAIGEKWSKDRDIVNGDCNSQACLRLFGRPESEVRVTLYRDNHGWCPYCQKVWLWLEEKEVPYRVRKVSMFCYGEKEKWYKDLVPSGMLPAIELDQELITESDVILQRLESAFGPLGQSLTSPRMALLRRLERILFTAWCRWLCYRQRSVQEEEYCRDTFVEALSEVDRRLQATPGPFFLDHFSTAEPVFVPYLERMCASLFYYKGFVVRDPAAFPGVCEWFRALEARASYRGTQGDFHTHAHDLPPQMGGCYVDQSKQGESNRKLTDCGPWEEVPDTTCTDNVEMSQAEVVACVAKHRRAIARVNPADNVVVDEALRVALSNMVTGRSDQPPAGADLALRYVRDRVSVPRDMGVLAAKHARAAMERTAALAGTEQGPPVPTRHRRDQSPLPFAYMQCESCERV